MKLNVQHAAESWSNRHPILYFNWSSPIHNTENAEIVITSSFDVFRAKEKGNTLGYLAPLGYTSTNKNVWYEDHVEHRGFDNNIDIPEKKTRSTMRGSKTDRIKTQVLRYEIYMNPYACFHLTHSLAEACHKYDTSQYRSYLWTTAALSLLLIRVVSSDKSYDICGVFAGALCFIIAVSCLLLTYQVHTSCNGGQYTKQTCYSFEEVLSHEIGHALGLGHPDGYYDLVDKGTANYWGYVPDMKYVDINPMDPCRSVVMRQGLHVCPSVNSPSQCLKVPECIFDKHQCKSIHHQALMLSTGRPYYGGGKNYMTEDDLAGLFFLYPVAERGPKWGLDRLPLREFSYIKLQALAEDYFDGHCATIDNKDDILECIYEQKSLQSIAELKKIADSICQQKRFDECNSIIKLLSAAHNAVQLIRQGRSEKFIDSNNLENVTFTFAKAFVDAAEVSMHSLIGEQLLTENSLYDSPNYYTSYADIDSVIDIFLNRHDGDNDNDGVHDRDRDNDGLPDSIESGLDALKQMLEDVKNGNYRGRWDVDGDGIENSLDDIDNGVATDVETCTESDKDGCAKAY